MNHTRLQPQLRPQPRRVDAHMHFWNYDPKAYPWIGSDMSALATDRQPQDIYSALHTHGFDAAIAVQARADSAETNYLLALAEKYPWIAGIVGWEELGAEDFSDRLDRWAAWPRLRGFRHQIQDEVDARAFMQAPAFSNGLRLLQQRGYVYDLLVLPHQIDDSIDLCAAHDRHWLVLDHLGKPPLREMRNSLTAFDAWRSDLRRLGSLPHVVCKLSGLITEADWKGGLNDMDRQHLLHCLDEALQVFGPQRLLFGSDWPVCLLADSYQQVYELVQCWALDRLTPDECSELLGGTAVRCYGLQTPQEPTRPS